MKIPISMYIQFLFSKLLYLTVLAIYQFTCTCTGYYVSLGWLLQFFTPIMIQLKHQWNVFNFNLVNREPIFHLLLLLTLCTQSLEKRSEYRQSFAEGGIDGLHLLELSTSEMAGTVLLFGHSSWCLKLMSCSLNPMYKKRRLGMRLMFVLTLYIHVFGAHMYRSRGKVCF